MFTFENNDWWNFATNGEQHDLYQWNKFLRMSSKCSHRYSCCCLECLFIGLFANIALFCLALKKLVSRNDKLYLANIVASNLFSLLGSFWENYWSGEIYYTVRSKILFSLSSDQFHLAFQQSHVNGCFMLQFVRKYRQISKKSVAQFFIVLENRRS